MLLMATASTAASTAASMLRPVRPAIGFTRLRYLSDGRVGEVRMLSGALGAFDLFLKTSPYKAAFLTCAFKAACSDTISQKLIEKQSKLSIPRNVAFILYGGGYQGVVQYFIFNRIFPVLFGEGTDPATVATKVLVDQLVLTPFLCLPMAYLVKAVIFQQSLLEGLRRYTVDAKKALERNQPDPST
eukprot:CAMPEP_0174706588 /NCGR_PEP_ID=MMETSP1094-20130205/9376_1 /TAXON_ID=156173 /ORGANISM="Chrysochromulina brevifilum, Strain UTEX LB 985" /LENGTH=185 /DNA_ID=CAMNT_0015904863 /DNA_START=138 /DNA_END=695 /DNA_ORIENTATION=-